MKLTAESTVINDSKLNSDISDARNIADSTAQYFWFKSTGSDTGAHISEKTQAEFIANPSGGNLLARSNGIAIREGMTELVTIDTDSIDFYNGSIHELSVSGSQTSYLTEGEIEFAPNTNTTSRISGGRFNSTGSVYDGQLDLWTSASSAGTIVSEASIKLRASTLGDSECRIEADEIDINNKPLADFVVYQGTSGIWTYREWKSGIAECWGTYTASIAVNISATAYGGYRSDKITAPSFPLPFASAPTVTATMNTAQGVWVNNVNDITTAGCSFYLSCGSSLASASRSIAFHVIGQVAPDPT